VEQGGRLVEVAEGSKLFSLTFLNSELVPFKNFKKKNYNAINLRYNFYIYLIDLLNFFPSCYDSLSYSECCGIFGILGEMTLISMQVSNKSHYQDHKSINLF
jgi:hypothetical protein